jgi:hypothetical protein
MDRFVLTARLKPDALPQAAHPEARNPSGGPAALIPGGSRNPEL